MKLTSVSVSVSVSLRELEFEERVFSPVSRKGSGYELLLIYFIGDLGFEPYRSLSFTLAYFRFISPQAPTTRRDFRFYSCYL